MANAMYTAYPNKSDTSLPYKLFTYNTTPNAKKGTIMVAMVLPMPFKLNTLMAPVHLPIIKLPQ